MRKVTITLVIFLGLAASGWYYLANKFEEIARNEIFTKIKDNESLITADTNSAIIEKYKFKIFLKDVTLFPKSDLLKTSADNVEITYHPLNDKITIELPDGKFKSEAKDQELYVIAQDFKLEFSRSILNDKEDGNIAIQTGPSATHWAKDNSIISRSKKLSANIARKLDQDGYYDFAINLNEDGSEFILNSQYIKSILETAATSGNSEKEIAASKIVAKLVGFIEYYNDVYNKTGPMDVSIDGHLKLLKKNVDNIIAVAKGEMDYYLAVTAFVVGMEDAIFTLKHANKNSNLSQTVTYNFIIGKGKLNLGLDLLASSNYTEGQKADISNATNKLIMGYLNDDNRFEPLVDQGDLKAIVDGYLDIKETKLALNFDCDLNSKICNHDTGLKLDNFAVDSKGSVENTKYNGELKISTPKLLINTFSSLYNDSIKRILEKYKAKEDFDANNISLIVDNFKNNGMGFLAAFDKKDSLKDDDAFEANINYNHDKLEFKINYKGILHFITDQRVVDFLKEMPGAK